MVGFVLAGNHTQSPYSWVLKTSVRSWLFFNGAWPQTIDTIYDLIILQQNPKSEVFNQVFIRNDTDMIWSVCTLATCVKPIHRSSLACHFLINAVSRWNGSAETLLYLNFPASMHSHGNQPRSRGTTPMEVQFDPRRLAVLLVGCQLYMFLVRCHLWHCRTCYWGPTS